MELESDAIMIWLSCTEATAIIEEITSTREEELTVIEFSLVLFPYILLNACLVCYRQDICLSALCNSAGGELLWLFWDLVLKEPGINC